MSFSWITSCFICHVQDTWDAFHPHLWSSQQRPASRQMRKSSKQQDISACHQADWSPIHSLATTKPLPTREVSDAGCQCCRLRRICCVTLGLSWKKVLKKRPSGKLFQSFHSVLVSKAETVSKISVDVGLRSLQGFCVSLIRASYAFGIASEARTTSRRDSSRSCPGKNGQNLEVSTFAKRACLKLISSPHSNLSQAPSCPCHILHGVLVWPL